MKSKKVTLTLAAITCAAAFMSQLGGSKVSAEENRVAHYMIQNNGDSWDGNHYYLADGTMVYNAFFCDGRDTYYLQADGTPMKDRLTYHPDGIHVIYFDVNGHEVFSDFSHISKSIAGADVDDMCFFDVNGYMYVDTLTYDKTGTKLYYVNQYGVLERNGWFQFSGYEFDAGLGFSGISGGYGYANTDCSLMSNTYTYDWNGNLVYMEGDGHLAGSQTGKPDGNGDPSGDGWYRANGNIYYFTPGSNEAAKGLTKIDDVYYYFNPDTSVMERNTVVKVDGINYAFGEDGKQIVALPLREFKSRGNVINGYVYEYDDSYNLIKKVYYEAGNIKSWSIYDYDAQGRLLEITDSDFDGVKQYTDYEYYSSGKESKCIFMDGDRNNILWVEYPEEYSDDGKKCIWTYKNNDGVIKWTEWDYDDAGRLIKNFDAMPDGSIKLIEEHEYYNDGGYTDKMYDENGDLYTQYTYNKFGNCIIQRNKGLYIEKTYDENNKLIKYIDEHYSFGGKVREEIIYNSYGDKEKDSLYRISDERYVYVYNYNYEYNDAGKKISSYSDKSMTSYEYDERGNCTTEISYVTGYDYDICRYTISASMIKYEYDMDGNKIREEIYCSDKTEYSQDGKLYKIEDFNWVINSIYTYYSTGQYMDIFQYNNGVLSSIEGRDINGEVIKKAEYDENGNLNYCDTYQYDYNTLGDLLCCTCYRDRGNGEAVEGKIQYEYRYDAYGNMLYYESHIWGNKIENEYVYR